MEERLQIAEDYCALDCEGKAEFSRNRFVDRRCGGEVADGGDSDCVQDADDLLEERERLCRLPCADLKAEKCDGKKWKAACEARMDRNYDQCPGPQ